jgi:hypothetical protein
MKADDDLYLRVEAYLASLELLAKVHRLYWGLAMRWGPRRTTLVQLCLHWRHGDHDVA